MRIKLSDSQIQTVIHLLSDFSGLMGIYLHGSVIKGTARPDSDLDIAMLLHHKAGVDPRLFIEVSGELASRLGRSVHLGILSLDNVVFAKEVIAHGKQIYCSDQNYCDTFAMNTFSFYAALNDIRQMILDAYIKKD